MPQQTIPILMYHQVDTEPPKGSPMRGLVVSPKTFSRHMAALSALGYQGKSMGDLMPYLKGEKHGKVFGITHGMGLEIIFQRTIRDVRRRGSGEGPLPVNAHGLRGMAEVGPASLAGFPRR